MARYAIAITLPDTNRVMHKIVEGDGQDIVLRKFFDDNMESHYSIDDQGYYYFKEDFFDSKNPVGSMLEI